MDYAFTYISNNGEAVEFGGDDIWLDDDSFRSADLSYSKSDNRIKGFYRGISKFTVNASAQTDSLAEAVELCNRIIRLGRYDRENLVPGTIRCGEYSTSGYIIGISFDPDDDMLGFITSFKIEIAVEDPVWVKEETFSYLKGSELKVQSADDEYDLQSADDEYDFPFDFPYDYMAPTHDSFEVRNRDTMPCNMRLTVYGPATNPAVRIGDNTYQVNCTVAEGSILIIDSKEKRIFERLEFGDEVSRLDSRERGSIGGGSYVFEKIPTGISAVSYNQSFGIDLTIIHEEIMPPFAAGGGA